jgi:biopolymer transport protein ExbD
MLVSLSMTHMRRVPINLPAATTAITDPKTPPFQIAIDANGVTTWDGKIVTLSEITRRIKASTVPGEPRVLIAADADARHKQVLGVLNAVREAGVEKVSFETQN